MKKKKKFAIHADFAQEAADKIAELDLVAVILGSNNRWKKAIDVEVQYERTDRDAIHEFEKFLDDQWMDGGYPADWAEEEGEPYEGEEDDEEDEEEDEDEDEDED